ncbi:MAG: hypothetical protein ACT6U0_26635 [Shinella sp.]|uniref:hypothetical protein n=1 Tax=Shinella sp. TaxID=1870904 RepID=UPI004036E1C9
MLRGLGYVVANRGDKNVGSETAACLALSSWARRMLCRLAQMPLTIKRLLGVKEPFCED